MKGNGNASNGTKATVDKGTGESAADPVGGGGKEGGPCGLPAVKCMIL